MSNENDTLWNQLAAIQSLPYYNPCTPNIISQVLFKEILEKWKNRIDHIAKRIAKQAQTNVEILENAGIYENLDDTKYKKSAWIAELFRTIDFAGNSGSLDVKTLQTLVFNSFGHSNGINRLTFELGWGQAKRDAGMLKTPGPCADLGEIISIARLGIILKAVQYLCGSRVIQLRIITGGVRFYQALFTRTAIDAAYNAQRVAIASAFGLSEIIHFDTINRYYSQEEIERRIIGKNLDHMPSISEDSIQYKFVLFNIDWYHLLGAKGCDRLPNPHSLEAPEKFLEWFGELSRERQNVMLRELLAAMANKNIKIYPVGKFLGNPAILEKGKQWMKRVGVLSTLKYQLISEVTPRDIESEACRPILLTVIPKPSKPYIPSLLLVGRRSGHVVPQHVVPVIDTNGATNYLPYFLVVNKYSPVFLNKSESEMFFWCQSDGQPLCFINGGTDVAIQALKQLLLVENY